MMPSFHAGDELLMDYATGALSEPVALLVATHLALCPPCRARVEAYEEVGGVLLETLDSEGVEPALRDAVMAKLDEVTEEVATAPDRRLPSSREGADLRVPEPLRGYLDGGLDSLAWKRHGPVHEVFILPNRSGITSRLLRAKAGTSIPQHTHEGTELTLVLTGAFADRGQHFARGDVATADGSVDHRPMAEPGEDCHCFIVNDARLRLTGPFSRLLNPFVRL